jgi:MerR family transcriptional regulator, thiopeptide resistance regulator
MAYSVKQLAKLSGVTNRTLHFYDEIELLNPAYHGPNGYRFYEEEQVLKLQQILFFRELGFELKQIQELLGRSDFDQVAALRNHRRVLQGKLERMQELIQTVDDTLAHIEGKKKMKASQLFKGFDPEKQAEYEQQLIERFGEEARAGIKATRRRVKSWTKADWERSSKEWNQICRGLVELMDQGFGSDSKEAQTWIGRHYEWLKQFWTPNRESYAGHGEFLVASELRKAYDAIDPRLPEFIGEGILAYAERELT